MQVAPAGPGAWCRGRWLGVWGKFSHGSHSAQSLCKVGAGSLAKRAFTVGPGRRPWVPVPLLALTFWVKTTWGPASETDGQNRTGGSDLGTVVGWKGWGSEGEGLLRGQHEVTGWAGGVRNVPSLAPLLCLGPLRCLLATPPPPPRSGTDSRPREPSICSDKTLGGARLFVNLAEFTLWEGVGGGGACPSPAFQGGLSLGRPARLLRGWPEAGLLYQGPSPREGPCFIPAARGTGFRPSPGA